MLEALFTSCREQRKSSHNRVSDNNRGEKSIIMLTCFLDLPRLASWRAYKAAWCISSLLYLPDKKLCCLFLTENNDTVHWKNGNKTWLTFLRPFFDKIDEDIFLFFFQRLASIASSVFQSTVQIQLAKIRFTIIIHQISWKGHVWVDVKAEMVYFRPQHVSNFLAHIVSKTTFYCDMSTFQSSGRRVF